MEKVDIQVWGHSSVATLNFVGTGMKDVDFDEQGEKLADFLLTNVPHGTLSRAIAIMKKTEGAADLFE